MLSEEMRNTELEIDLALQDLLFDGLQVAHDFHAVTASMLVPLAQPEKRENLVLAKAHAGQGFSFGYLGFNRVSVGESLFGLCLRICHHFFLHLHKTGIP